MVRVVSLKILIIEGATAMVQRKHTRLSPFVDRRTLRSTMAAYRVGEYPGYCLDSIESVGESCRAVILLNPVPC
jgi:hypothetical protein